MANRINCYKESRKIIQEVASFNKKPSILLHACCGPCAAFPIEDLLPYFDITIFFNNSNIYPGNEYERRLNELKKFLANYSKDNNVKVGLVTVPYENEKYNIDLEPYKDESEGFTRCKICYEKRMDEAFKYADDNNFDYFATVMTISRQKNSAVLNEIGKKLSVKYKTKYFFSDFKKNNGINRGHELRDLYNLYQQQYCGCKYSYEKRIRKDQERGSN